MTLLHAVLLSGAAVAVVGIVTAALEMLPPVRVRMRRTERPTSEAWRVYLSRAVRSPHERREATEWEMMPTSGKAWRVGR